VLKPLLSIALCVAVSGCGVARTGVKMGAIATKGIVKTTVSVVK
jgi:hypothetical protein